MTDFKCNICNDRGYVDGRRGAYPCKCTRPTSKCIVCREELKATDEIISFFPSNGGVHVACEGTYNRILEHVVKKIMSKWVKEPEAPLSMPPLPPGAPYHVGQKEIGQREFGRKEIVTGGLPYPGCENGDIQADGA